MSEEKEQETVKKTVCHLPLLAALDGLGGTP
jgi:hypothetical protein